jgi:hypothetical protein
MKAERLISARLQTGGKNLVTNKIPLSHANEAHPINEKFSADADCTNCKTLKPIDHKRQIHYHTGSIQSGTAVCFIVKFPRKCEERKVSRGPCVVEEEKFTRMPSNQILKSTKKVSFKPNNCSRTLSEEKKTALSIIHYYSV